MLFCVWVVELMQTDWKSSNSRPLFTSRSDRCNRMRPDWVFWLDAYSNKKPLGKLFPGFFVKAVLERGRRDSNPQHPARQAGALTS